MFIFNKGKRLYQEAKRTTNLSEQIRLYKEAADLGYAPAAYDLACEYSRTHIFNFDNSEYLNLAGIYYIQAAEGGLVQAFKKAAEAYIKGWGVEKNLEKAYDWYEKEYHRNYCSVVTAYELAKLADSMNRYSEALRWAESIPKDESPFYSYNADDIESLITRMRKLVVWEKLSIDELIAQAALLYEKREYEETFLMYEYAASRGNVWAIYCLGFQYFWGLGTEKDYDAAMFWLRKAEQAGVYRTYYVIGLAYWHGRGVSKDTSIAFSYFKKAIDHNDRRAHRFVGHAYRLGEGVEQNLMEAKKYYTISIENKLSIGECAYHIAEIYRELGVYEKALKWANEAVDQSYSKGQKLIEKLEIDFIQIDYDNEKIFNEAMDNMCSEHYEEAFELFLKLAQKGYINGMRKVALCYETGLGVEQDAKKAVDYYLMMEKYENYSCLFKIAEAYRKGVGRYEFRWQAGEYYKDSYNKYKKDAETLYNICDCLSHDSYSSRAEWEKIKQNCVPKTKIPEEYIAELASALGIHKSVLNSWLERGRENTGETPAQIALAIAAIYQQGLYGVQKDEAKQVPFIIQAAEGGCWQAFGKAAELYTNGFGVKQDLSLACYWLKRSLEENKSTNYNKASVAMNLMYGSVK